MDEHRADENTIDEKNAPEGNSPTTTHAEWGAGNPHLLITRDDERTEYALDADVVRIGSAAGNELKDAASKAGITLPAGVSVEEKAAAERLGTFSGKEFDRNYMTLMVKDHK